MTRKTYFDGLKKIFERVCEILDDEENCYDFQKAKDNTVKQFKKWGIDILDDEGYLKSFSWIVADVAKVYSSMSDEDKEFCLEILCGKTETNLKHIVREYLESKYDFSEFS